MPVGLVNHWAATLLTLCLVSLVLMLGGFLASSLLCLLGRSVIAVQVEVFLSETLEDHSTGHYSNLNVRLCKLEQWQCQG